MKFKHRPPGRSSNSNHIINIAKTLYYKNAELSILRGCVFKKLDKFLFRVYTGNVKKQDVIYY